MGELMHWQLQSHARVLEGQMKEAQSVEDEPALAAQIETSVGSPGSAQLEMYMSTVAQWQPEIYVILAPQMCHVTNEDHA